MPHIYNVFEVGVDGTLFDIGKTVEINNLPTYYDNGDFRSSGDAAQAVCTLYGFTAHFCAYYYANRTKRLDENIDIVYQYVENDVVVFKPTWHLKKGI